MSKRTRQRAAVLAAVGLVAALAYLQGRSDERGGRGLAFAGGKADAFARATKALPERDAYFPNSEDLGPDEMRIISCGTGMPSARESQAASCFLLELGNGDKFIFDGGTGSDVRIGSLEIPYDLLDKIFISHLHTDHWGSFPA